ncbi:hypothetical protein CRG98_020621, partial [Punica granatum]
SSSWSRSWSRWSRRLEQQLVAVEQEAATAAGSGGREGTVAGAGRASESSKDRRAGGGWVLSEGEMAVWRDERQRVGSGWGCGRGERN